MKKQLVKNYILEAIDGEPYEVYPIEDKEKLQFIMDTFKSEYLHNNNAHYYVNHPAKVFASWIAGLPTCFGIAWENYRILELAKEFGMVRANSSEKYKDKVLETWFETIAVLFLELCVENNVSI